MGKVYRAAFVVFPRVEELDLVGAWEALASTQHLSTKTYFLTQRVGTKTGLIKCAHGVTINADRSLSDFSKYDVIIVPGGPGVRNIVNNKGLLHELKKAYEAGKLVCSVCTGAFCSRRSWDT